MNNFSQELLRELLREAREELPFVLTVKDIQKLLPFGRSKVYELLKEGVIPNKKVEGKILIPREQFLIWMYCDERENQKSSSLLLNN
ncbi:helix-turn-helix domain-containing protein [Orenia metallireducens]|nr:helix-turn-helix domain-containing protein [Orenia metallireducens]